MNDADLTRRAYAAYFRTGEYPLLQPNQTSSGVTVYDDKAYVVLSNGFDVLAVYRVRNDGVLKRMKRWPAEVTGGI